MVVQINVYMQAVIIVESFAIKLKVCIKGRNFKFK